MRKEKEIKCKSKWKSLKEALIGLENGGGVRDNCEKKRNAKGERNKM